MAEESVTRRQLQDEVKNVLSLIDEHITAQDAVYKGSREVLAGAKHLPEVVEAVVMLYESIQVRSEFHCDIHKQILGIMKDMLETRG